MSTLFASYPPLTTAFLRALIQFLLTGAVLFFGWYGMTGEFIDTYALFGPGLAAVWRWLVEGFVDTKRAEPDAPNV